MGKGPGKSPRVNVRSGVRRSERPEASGTPVTMVTGAEHTSTRCRATHDVPYTLRCVLEGLHPVKSMPGVGTVVAHKDKRGVWWEESIGTEMRMVSDGD